MNSFLLNRQLGSISPQALASAQNERLLRSLQAASNVGFALKSHSESDGAAQAEPPTNAKKLAHVAGVSSITIDPFEGK